MSSIPGQHPAPALAPSSGRVLAALSLTAVLAALGTSIANIALPSLAMAFGAPMGAVQWVILAFLLASTMLVVPVGRIGDRLGRRRVLQWGVGVFTLASALAAFASSLSLLIAARALQGVGAAAMAALTVGLVRQSVPAERLGGAMGMLGASTAAGMALGPSLGGALLAGPGWRAVFAVLVPLGLLSLLMLSRALPGAGSGVVGESGGRADHRLNLDAAGTVALALTLAAYTLAVTVQPGGRLGVIVLLGVAAAGLVVFLRIERGAVAPLVDLAQLRQSGAIPQLAASLLGATIMMSFMVIGPFYLSGALGLDAGWLGLVMAVGPVMAVITGVPAGRLVDLLGPQRVSSLGLAGMALGMLTLVVLAGWFGLPGFLLGSIILTPGNQLFMAANNTLVMTSAGAAHQGAMSGTLNLARNIGMITGASVMGLLYRVGAATALDGPAGARAGMQVAFGCAAGLGVLALLLTGLRHRVRAGASAGV